MNTIITTNLRIPEDVLKQIRAAAIQAGISTNEYIKRVLKKTILEEQLGITRFALRQERKEFYRSLLELGHIAEGIEYHPEEMSDDDKVIYDL